MRSVFVHAGILMVVAACTVSPVRAEKLILEPTPMFLRHEGDLHRAVLAVVNEEEAMAHEAIRVTQGETEEVFALNALPRWMDRLVVPVPVREAPTEFSVSLEKGGRSGSVKVEPERRWEVFIVPHTHLDIGFTNVPEVVWTQQAENLKGVIALCEMTADWPEAARFRWTIEGTALFENFAERHPDEVERLVALIRDGRVELTGGWANLLTELSGSEALARSMAPAGRIADTHGVQIDTAMLNDVPGYTWAMPMLWSKLGIEFANLRANGIRGKFIWHRPGAVPRPFRWESPDGSSVIVWYTDSYREANFLRQAFPEAGAEAVDNKLQSVLHDYLRAHLHRARANGYDRDVLQLRMGGDNYDAAESVCHWVKYWNERWAYPRLRLATSREFYHALMNDGRPIPTFRGDIPDWWADGAASSAEPTGTMRVVQDQIHGMQFATHVVENKPVPFEQLWHDGGLYQKILSYCEHTWGASSHWYEQDPTQVERQWAAKRKPVDELKRAYDTIVDTLRETSTQRSHLSGKDGDRSFITVVNPTSWARTDAVQLEERLNSDHSFLRGPKGKDISVQDGQTFIASDVPPFGSLSYEIVTAEQTETPKRASRYSITIDPDTGFVIDVVHRPSGRSLVDSTARFPFNAYLMQRGAKRENVLPFTLKETRSPSWKQVTMAEPTTKIDHRTGPVFEEWIVRTTGPQLNALTQKIRVYPDLDVIDIENTVDKIADEAVEQIYFGFPFALDSPNVRLEIPWGSMAPGDEQLTYSATDFYSVEHWVDMADDDGGILWATREAPVVVFGDLWPECWRDEFTMPDGHLFSYVMTNTWFTNYRRQQGGKMTFRYRIQAYDGPMDPVRAERFGDSFARPLVAAKRERRQPELPAPVSYLAVEPDHVKIETIKRADDGKGVMIRLQELGVGDATARVTLKHVAGKAYVCDPAERQLRELQVQQKQERSVVKVAMRRHEMVTLRVE